MPATSNQRSGVNHVDPFCHCIPLYARFQGFHPSGVALMSKAMGNMDKAIVLYEQSLGIKRALLGPDHPDTASQLYTLAMMNKMDGRLEGALQLFEQELEVCIKRFGLEHVETKESIENLEALRQEIANM